MSELNDIKRDLFFTLLGEVGRVFIHVRPSMELEIGRRGLVGDELKEGITLVFNSRMKFDWGEFGIDTTLVFGTTPEKCYIPASAIDAVYSPEMNVQLSVEIPDEPMADKPSHGSGKGRQEKRKTHPHVNKGEKVIQVDFRHKSNE